MSSNHVPRIRKAEPDCRPGFCDGARHPEPMWQTGSEAARRRPGDWVRDPCSLGQKRWTNRRVASPIPREVDPDWLPGEHEPPMQGLDTREALWRAGMGPRA